MKSFKKDNLNVKIYKNRALMGEAAAKDIKETIAHALKEKKELNIIFAAAPSQNEVLNALAYDKSIEWCRINAFHMDEYIGLDRNAPQGFGNFLKSRMFQIAPFKSVNYIDGTAPDPEKESERYGAILNAREIDIVIMGIGENGHIAFNDPPTADFSDPKKAKTVKLDETCRHQQVNDGCFTRIEDVPTHAITLTIPTLVNASHLFCIVPAASKARAVYETLEGNIDEHCPASILRTCGNAILYLDADSSKLL